MRLDNTFTVDDWQPSAAPTPGNTRSRRIFGWGSSPEGGSTPCSCRYSRTDCLLDIGEGFLFGFALGHDLGQGRDKHRKTTAFLRLENDGIAVACRHDVAPAVP